MTRNRQIWYTDGALFTAGKEDEDNLVIALVKKAGMNGPQTEEGLEWGRRIVASVNFFSGLRVSDIENLYHIVKQIGSSYAEEDRKKEQV